MSSPKSQGRSHRAFGAAPLLPALLVVCFAVYLWAGLDVLPPEAHRIRIDMARPVSIEYPFEIAEVGQNGEKGLWICAGAGRGWLDEAGGSASYRFYAPADGTYVIWAYALWHDECTNAVYAQIDGGERAVIGNDPVFDEWHWCRGFELELERGFHVLRLSNHSDNISVQKVFLADSPDCAPGGAEGGALPLFRDDFNGCDHGNFPLWEAHGGSWEVKRREELGEAENLLVGSSNDRALLTLEREGWAECALGVSVRVRDGGERGMWCGLCFGLRGPSEYHQIRWSEQPAGGSASMELVRVRPGAREVLASWEVPWEAGQWHRLEVEVRGDGILVTIDGGLRREARLDRLPSGGIGLSLLGELEAHFDDVLVWTPRPEGSERREGNHR